MFLIYSTGGQLCRKVYHAQLGMVLVTVLDNMRYIYSSGGHLYSKTEPGRDLVMIWL
jgi:hypothetical protein